MSTLMYTELRKSYSWWWDSHISPKNATWLQENLTDMDLKVKAMIKLIEEDVTSFPLRDEMYYKKRPELLKLVEEFYREYHALAERYDRATGALRHAHRTMAAVFPYHIPLALPDESSSDAELDIPVSNLSSYASGASRSWDASKHGFRSEALGTNKGLKQFAEIVSPREETARARLPKGKVRRGLSFQEEEERAYVNLVKKNANEEEKVSLTKHLNLSKNVQNLADVMSKFESEKEAAIVQNQLSKESITSLEIEVSMLKDEMRKLNNEMEMAAMKLSRAEKHCQALEKEKDSLQLQLEEANLKFAQLKEMDRRKVSLEEEVSLIKAINSSLNEHNLACALKIKHLKDEIIFLKETNDKLEDEIQNQAKSNKILQQELCSLKEDRNELDLKMEETSLHVESLQIFVKGLRCARIELVESLKNLQDENLLLLNKLKDMESVIEKNFILENYLYDAKAEVEELREHIKALKDSFFTLNASDDMHVCVKAALASQLEAFSESVEKLTKKNTFLKNSLADANTELESLQCKTDELEHPCNSLSDANLYLLSQKNCVISQVDNVHMSLVNQEAAHAVLEDNHLNLLKEKDVSIETVLKLEGSLNVMLKEDESLIQSTSAHLANVENQLLLLQNSQLREEELEAAQQNCFSHIIEIFILKRSLCELKCSLIEELGHKSHMKSNGIQPTVSDNQTHLSDHCGENQFLHIEKSIYLSFLKETAMEKVPLSQEPGMVNRKSFLLQQEQDDAQVMRSELEKQVATLLEAGACKDKELARAYEENRMLSEALNRCSSEVGVLKLREEFLCSELKKEQEELERCEEETLKLLREVQFSVVNAAVLEEKMIELESSWENLELSSMVQMKTLNEDITLKNACLDWLETKIVGLENENGRLRTKLNELLLLLNSLGNAIAKVEGHVCQLAKHAGNKDNSSVYLPEETNHQENPVEHATMGDFYPMQEMVNRVEDLQKLVIHTKDHLDQERVQTAAKLDSVMREIEELKLKQSHNRGKETPIGEHGMVIKDIQLDHISNSCSMASEVIKVPAEDWSRRLESNAERLSALQASAQELKLKMDKLWKNICCNSSKHDSLRARLKMAEEAISELVDSNNMRILKALERARQGSSKIGKLELELEKMHHIFVKLGEECVRDKNGGGDGNRVILRDLLHGRKVRQATKISPLWCKP